jgi:broad specificity phosphatase PhoE
VSETRSDIYLARHGQTAYNAEPRFQGRLPVPLDPTGRAQAAELAERAVPYGFAVLYASPLERALETARVVGDKIGLEPRLDARLAETDCGDWTGRAMPEVQAEDAARFQEWVDGDPDFRFPGGESFAEQAKRVQAAIADIRAAPERPVLVVCHRHTMRFALSGWSAEGRPRLGGDWRAIGNGEVVPLT